MPGPSEAQEVVERFQLELYKREAQAGAEMIRAYAPVYEQLKKESQELIELLDVKGWQGMQGQAIIKRQGRIRKIASNFERNVVKFAEDAVGIVTEAQLAAVGLARDGSAASTIAGLPAQVYAENLANLRIGWSDLPEDTLEAFVGITADGAPLNRLFVDLAGDSAGQIRGTMTAGIATGQSPRVIAKRLENVSGLPLSKSLTIARTETLRAYREATRAQYQNNSRVVKGYIRNAAKDERVCAACIALDGDRYELNEPFDGHPNCRCAMLPEVVDYWDLGLHDVPRGPDQYTAKQWFEDQSEEVQRKILQGPRFDAWKDGVVQLHQFAVKRSHPVWGQSAVVKSLDELGIKYRTPATKVRTLQEIKVKKTMAFDVTDTSEPLRPPGPLKDPQSGKPVRGSYEVPPPLDFDPSLGREALEFVDSRGADFITPGYVKELTNELKQKGVVIADLTDREVTDFLIDVGIADLRNMSRYGDVGEASELVSKLVGEYFRLVDEQVAWARAVRAADEISYDLLSPLEAYRANQAIADVMIKYEHRPMFYIGSRMREIDLEHVGGGFGEWNGACYDGRLWINPHKGGRDQVRIKGAIGANERTRNQYYEGIKTGETVSKQEEVDMLMAKIEFKKQELEEIATSGAMEAWQKQYDEARDLTDRLLLGSGPQKDLERNIRELTAQLQDIELEAGRLRATGWFTPTQTIEQAGIYRTMVHELGHYAHGRYGIDGVEGLTILGRSTRAAEQAATSPKARNFRANAKGRWMANDKAGDLSAYAHSNVAEFFAEAHVDYVINGGVNLTPEVYEYVDKVVKWQRPFNHIPSRFETWANIADPDITTGLPIVNITTAGRVISMRKIVQTVATAQLTESYDLRSMVLDAVIPGFGRRPQEQEEASESR